MIKLYLLFFLPVKFDFEFYGNAGRIDKLKGDVAS